MLIRRSKSANSSGGNSSAFGRSWWPQISQSVTTRAGVIGRAQVFGAIFKVGGTLRNPQFRRRRGPTLAAARRARGLLIVPAKNLAGGCVHKVDLLTHDTGHRLIRILVLRNLFGGGQSLNAEARVRAAVDGHSANQRCRADGRFDLGQSVRESDDQPLSFVISVARVNRLPNLTLDRRPILTSWRRALAVALAPSQLVGVAETARARVGV